MRIEVEMLAFMGGEVRAVEVPDADAEGAGEQDLLGMAFHYGQNDVQPVPGRCSVSVGDVVRLPGGRRFRVDPVGFSEAGSGSGD